METKIRPGVYFIEDAPEFEIVNGIARIRSASGGVPFEMVCTPANLLLGIARATAAYQDWESSREEPARFVPVYPSDGP